MNIIAYCCVITCYLTLKSFTIRIKFTIQCHKWGVHNCEWTMTEVILCFVCLLLTPSTHNHFFRHYGILCEKAVRVSLEKKRVYFSALRVSWVGLQLSLITPGYYSGYIIISRTYTHYQKFERYFLKLQRNCGLNFHAESFSYQVLNTIQQPLC